MSKKTRIRLNSIKTYLSKPQNVILVLTGILVTFTTIAPIVAIIRDTVTIHPGTIDQYLSGKGSGFTLMNYVDLFTSKLAKTNLWTPLLNTTVLAIG
ncbi:MAG: iron ABC transporter permease, partial [Erysipelotrichaceae bacterium]|nr:iron ABC transporter permease [Erysipelotrichaceae bacterium]